MCVVAAKYLPDYGWVGIKNRDRNYKPIITIFQSNKGGVERLLMRDDLTGYMEGINEFGISVMSAATAVKDDELQLIQIRQKKKARSDAAKLVRQDKLDVASTSEDGIKLGRALISKNINEALKIIQETKPLGNHILFDESTCYVIEVDLTREEKLAAKEQRAIDPLWEHPSPETRDYTVKTKKVSKKDFVLRTNHGIMIDYAGYQKDKKKMTGDKEDPDYIQWMEANHNSSLTRFNTVKTLLTDADSVDSMLAAMSDRSNSDPQLNPLRTASRTDKKALRTTGQQIFIPKHKVFKYRNIWSTLRDSIKINGINKNNSVTYLDLLSYHEDIYESKFNNLIKSIILN
jgi:hypothetical protein